MLPWYVNLPQSHFEILLAVQEQYKECWCACYPKSPWLCSDVSFCSTPIFPVVPSLQKVRAVVVNIGGPKSVSYSHTPPHTEDTYPCVRSCIPSCILETSRSSLGSAGCRMHVVVNICCFSRITNVFKLITLNIF